MLKSSFLVLLLFCSLCLCGQGLLFNRLTSEEGLAPGAVLSIAQDGNGFLWFGTQNGLNRFDTRRFKIYKSQGAPGNDVPENYITRLLVDSHKVLWVGTRNGLNRYNPVTDRLDPVLLGKSRGEGLLSISCIYEDKQNALWVWSSAGLFRLDDRKDGRFTPIGIPDSVAGLSVNNNIRTIYQDHQGGYWIGSSFGLTQMTSENGKWHFRCFRHDERSESGLSDNYVTVIFEDKAGRLWIGTQQGGLNLYDRRTGTFKHYQACAANGLVNNNIRDIRMDTRGMLWIGTQGGISIYDPATGRFDNYQSIPDNVQTLSHNSVYSIFMDSCATVWIGTYWGGVNSVSADNTPFHVYKSSASGEGINNSVVSALSEDAAGNLWVGTEGSGLNYINRATGGITWFRHHPGEEASLGSDLVKVIYRDSDEHVWIGTHGGGLNLFNPAAGNFTRYFYRESDPAVRTAEILTILESREGIFWVGMQTGLRAFRRTGTTLHLLPDNRLVRAVGTKSVKSVLQSVNGDLWVGTSGDLLLMQHNSDTVYRFSTKEGLPKNNINCIHEDGNGSIWIGCAFGGLALYTPGGAKKFTIYTKENGLPDDNIAAILEDKQHNLWISTGNGLSKLDVKNGSFKNYTKSDGLAGNIFNINSCYNSSSGEMLFGGYKGLTFFRPDEIRENPFAPVTFLTGVKLFDHPVTIGQSDGLLEKEISLTSDIRFTHLQNVFTLEFASLNYVQPEKNNYAFKLEGFDSDWNYTSNPAATYMNLPPGSYTFFAKGTNNDGVWGKPAQLRITVLPPIWKTIWAYGLYVLFAAAVVFFVVRFFVLRSLIRRDHELTRMKLDFFTNISHEMRSRLSLIIGPAERLLLINREDYENSRQLKIIRKNSESLLHLLTELMDFRKAESGNLPLQVAEQDIVSFLREVFAAFEDQVLFMNIQYGFKSSDTSIRLYFDRVQLEKVFYNLFYNACKFTPSGGRIEAAIEEEERAVVITIKDNGRGVAPENLPKLFTNYFQEDDDGSDNKGYGIGLALAKSIIELHGGTITVDSTRTEEGNTTVFTVTLRKGNAHFNATVKMDKTSGTTGYKTNTPAGAGEEVLTAPESIKPGVTQKKYTILLIEDNEEILAFNREVLEKDYHVVVSTNGSEGWKTAVDLIPDIIVSDVMMPGMDGYTLCSQLKSDERTNHIPVILLTAMSSSSQQLSGLQKGADVYLTKPFSIQVLALHISNLLSLREKIHQRLMKQLVFPSEGQTDDEEQQQEETTAVIEDPFLLKVIAVIEENMDEPDFNVDAISRKLAISRPVLYKKLNMLTGLTVNDFIRAIRMKKATLYLDSAEYNISEVAYKVGYSDPKYFSREFKKHFGKSPRDWKQKGS
nr:hybrid sensor histidine kinase/response regulator transcription factor [uncultured Chitinophaga sp.]